jgi:GcrA cell cycle regulator
MVWTEAMLATLRQMWPEGHVCSIIGKKLGVSPSAVAGKAHRLGLPHRPPAIKTEGPAVQERRDATRRATIETRKSGKLPPQPAEVSRTAVHYEPMVRPLSPPHTCSWPLGEPGRKGFRFCGEKPEPGKPYCAAHCRLAYVKTK